MDDFPFPPLGAAPEGPWPGAPSETWWQAFGFELPVGAILPFAGLVRPGTVADAGETPVEAFGWLPCDGRSLKRGDAPELFAAIGTLYGGSGDSFDVPDLRGQFLRGFDPTARVDQDAGERKPENRVGSTQADALQDHVHDFLVLPTPGTGGTDGEGIAPETNTTEGPSTAPGADPVKTSLHETRPVNVAVNFIIKFRSLR